MSVVHATRRSGQWPGKEVAKLLVSDHSVLDPIGKFVENMTDNTIAGASKKKSVLCLLLHPRQDLEIPHRVRRKFNTREARWRRGRHDTTAKGPNRRQELIPLSSAKSFLESDFGVILTAIVEEKKCVFILNVIHITNSQFRNVVDYHTYRLGNKLQSFSEKLVAGTGIYAKQMESIIKPCLFDDRDPIATFRFLD